jgi:hypothetical protein
LTFFIGFHWVKWSHPISSGTQRIYSSREVLFDETLFPPLMGLDIPNMTMFDAMKQSQNAPVSITQHERKKQPEASVSD